MHQTFACSRRMFSRRPLRSTISRPEMSGKFLLMEKVNSFWWRQFKGHRRPSLAPIKVARARAMQGTRVSWSDLGAEMNQINEYLSHLLVTICGQQIERPQTTTTGHICICQQAQLQQKGPAGQAENQITITIIMTSRVNQWTARGP